MRIKRLLAMCMACVILATGCAQNTIPTNQENTKSDQTSEAVETQEPDQNIETDTIPSTDNTGDVNNTDVVRDDNDSETVSDDGLTHVVVGDDEEPDDTDYSYEPEFSNLNDEALRSYVEDAIYSELVSELDSDEYYIEKVSAVYISQDYIDELAYNSQANIYFGYTLEDLDAQFQGTRYVFTLENGETVVRPFEAYDDTYDQIIRNVAMGTGVILVCVTVSMVTAGAGAPAVSIIFATAAKTGTVMALSSSTLGGISAGVVTGIETGDMNAALKAAELSASENYKWGAITGVIAGGVSSGINYGKVMNNLRGVQLNLTTQEAAAIQMQTGYPAEVISQFHSMEEFKVFQSAGLKAQLINGEMALVRNDIDLYNIVDEMGRNNLVRMQKGLSPIGIDDAGNLFKYELHHVGQEADGVLAILTTAEHDNAALHGFKAISEINRPEFDSVRRHFWKTMANLLTEGGL